MGQLFSDEHVMRILQSVMIAPKLNILYIW